MSGLERLRCAVTTAQIGSGWWALAVSTQRDKTAPQVDHADLYGLAGEVVATLRTLEDLAEVMARQTAGYAQGRVLRDDAGGDPAERLALATTWIAELRTSLAAAQRDANAYWSAIGHISADHEPLDATTDPGADESGATGGPGAAGEGGGS